MKNLLLLLVFMFSQVSLAEPAGVESAEEIFGLNCEQSAIAPVDDQIDTSLAIAFSKYEIDPNQMVSIETSEVNAWKDMSVEPGPGQVCVRNVEVQYLLNITYIQQRPNHGLEICERLSVVRLYKHFLTDNAQDIAERAYWHSCAPVGNPDPILACADVSCPRVDDIAQYPHPLGSCDCRSMYDMVTSEAVGERFDDFYVPGNFEQAPYGVLPYQEFKQTAPLAR